MKFSYKYSNLIGTVYKGGNILFTPNGNSLICAVGNRLSIFDLKNNTTRTLPLEARHNYNAIALSPDGKSLIAITELGEAQYISMVSYVIVHRHKFHRQVQFVDFSPDGIYFAVAMENHVLVFHSSDELTGGYSPFKIQRSFLGGYDEITWLDWSSDSRFFAIGCKDSSTRIYSVCYLNNFRSYILGGHTEPIVACFFENDSLHINTISANGQLCLWESSLSYLDFRTVTKNKNKKVFFLNEKNKIQVRESREDIYSTDYNHDANNETTTNAIANIKITTEENKKNPFFYKKLGRHNLADQPRKEVRDAYCTAAHYNCHTKIMVVAFSSGAFYLYEIPDVLMIHSLSTSNFAISAVCFNCTGDWVALASKESGQILVWEWQSEQYIMKQQSHKGSDMSCISFCPDGQYIASGGYDGKIKLWNTRTGFCFFTFTDHQSTITSVEFNSKKKILISSSLDSTVRAFDMSRYRNFRSFTTPRPVQFACATIDASGEFVAAGGQDFFEIYLWSIKIGSLLEVISGHEGPVVSIKFSPLATSSTLISGSWDKTLKIWNCLETHSQYESLDLLSDITCLAFNPNSEHIAVATINGNITVFDVTTATQISTIEGRNDLSGSRSDKKLLTARKNMEGKFFVSIEYSLDGKCILAGGNSIYICIYQVMEAILLKKFAITKNHCFDGLSKFINRRDMGDFGNLNLIEYREKYQGCNMIFKKEDLKKKDISTKKFKTELNVFSVKFSPTGQSFCAASTEGLCIYSFNKGVVFDPFNLSIEVTPKAIKNCLRNHEYARALKMAIRLNEVDYITLVLERVPFNNISLVCTLLPNEISHRLLQNIAHILQNTHHVHFFLQWSCCLLLSFGNKDGVFQNHSVLALHEIISRKYHYLSNICNFNKFSLKALFKADEIRKQMNDINS